MFSYQGWNFFLFRIPPNFRMRKEMDEIHQELKKNKQMSQQPGIKERLKESETSLTRFQDYES